MVPRLITLAALLAVLSIGSASAQLLPPIEFDHPYKGELTVNIVHNEAFMLLACPISKDRNACARPNENSCVIYRREDNYLRATGWSPELVMRHEIGHCNGWPSDHRGGRPASASAQMTSLPPADNTMPIPLSQPKPKHAASNLYGLPVAPSMCVNSDGTLCQRSYTVPAGTILPQWVK